MHELSVAMDHESKGHRHGLHPPAQARLQRPPRRVVYPYTFRPACDRAGLSRLHFHELRHTFATLVLESRALTMYELSVAMGHGSDAVTNKVYAHLRKRDYSAHRAAFSAHIAAASAAPAPVVAIGG